VGRNC